MTSTPRSRRAPARRRTPRGTPGSARRTALGATPRGTPREDLSLPSARSGSEIWVDPNRVGEGRRRSEENLSRCACGAVLLFDATVCWKCHKRSQAEQEIEEAFGLFSVGERQSAPDTGFVERTDSMYDLPARSASEPLLCRPRCEVPERECGSLEHFGTAAEWEAILEDNDRAYRELESCRFELQERHLELEEKDRIIRRLQARLAELEPHEELELQGPPRAARPRCSTVGGEEVRARLAELGAQAPPAPAGDEELELQGTAPRAARPRGSMVGGEEPRAKIAQLDLPGMAVRSGRSSAVSAGTRGSDARWPEQQPTPAFGFEKHFAMELTEMASPSAGRRVSGASADNSENNLATEMTQMTLTASSAHRMSADSSGKQRWPTELTEITSASAWRMSADADSSQDLEAEMAGMASPSAWRMIADSSEEEEREEPRGSARPGPAGGPPLEVVAGATATYVGRLLAGSLARGAARSCADAAPQATPDAGARKASARGSLVGEVGRGDFEGASVDAATEEYAAAATLRDDEVTPGARSRVASVRHPPPASWLSGAADGGVPESALEEGGAATTLQVDEVKSSVRSVKASVRCVLSDAVDKGVLESALEVKPETRFLKASVRGLLSDAVDQGALERGLADEGAAVAPRAAEAELPLATPRARVRQLLVGSHRSGALQAELARLAPAVAVEAAPLKASVRGLLSDAVDQGALERGLADGPPGGLPPASLEACLATNHAMELLGRDALDAGLERRLAQATAREEMAYRAALGECERLKAELAATVSAELGRAGLLGIGEAVPSAPAAARTEPMPRGAVAAVAAAHGGAARGGLRGQVERVHEQASTVFAEMERRCRRLQQELVEQAAVARAPRSGPAGAQEAPLVCELRRECERLRADLAGAVLAERQAAREAARLRGQGALGEMRREWEHLRKELGGCLRELGGHSASLPEPAAPEPPRRAGGRRAAGPGGGELLLPVASC